jgi:hypothetical protein
MFFQFTSFFEEVIISLVRVYNYLTLLLKAKENVWCTSVAPYPNPESYWFTKDFTSFSIGVNHVPHH